MGHEAVTNKGYTSFIMTAIDKLEITLGAVRARQAHSHGSEQEHFRMKRKAVSATIEFRNLSTFKVKCLVSLPRKQCLTLHSEPFTCHPAPMPGS